MPGWAKRRGKIWTAYWSFKDVDGAWKQGSRSTRAAGLPNTKRAAEAYAAEQAEWHVEHSGRSNVSPAITVERWLEIVIAGRRVKPSSRHTYRAYAHRYVIPHLGNIPLRELTTAGVRAWVTTLEQRGGKRGRPLAVNTIAGAYRVLRMATAAAVEDGLLRRDPCRKVEMPTARSRPRVLWTEDELRAALPVLKAGEDALLWRLLLLGGLRIGEALALGWDDVDWRNRRIVIWRTLTTDERGVETIGDSAKTRASEAPVTLPASLMDALREHHDRRQFARPPGFVDNGLVFADVWGRPHKSRTLRRRLAALCVEAGVRVITPHALRHLSATLALSHGEHLKVVSERLRHASITMTADLYTHVSPRLSADAADRLDAALDALVIESTDGKQKRPGSA